MVVLCWCFEFRVPGGILQKWDTGKALSQFFWPSTHELAGLGGVHLEARDRAQGRGIFLFFHFILILFLCSAKYSSIPAAETTVKHPDPMVSYGKGQEMGIKMNRSTLHLSTCTNGPHIISHLILMMAPHGPDIERGT